MKATELMIGDWVKQAEEFLGISRTSISSCANGKLKTAGGYKWSYNFKIK